MDVVRYPSPDKGLVSVKPTDPRGRALALMRCDKYEGEGAERLPPPRMELPQSIFRGDEQPVADSQQR